MAEYKLIMPKMGESITEATIISWLKNEGDSIEVDEAVLEIATDKVDSEVPSMETGILAKKLFNEGDVVQVGEPVAIISMDGEVSQPVAESKVEAPQEVVEAANSIEKSTQEVQEQIQPAAISNNGNANRFYSPLVMNIARTEGISMEQLESIPGTGKDGRVTKRDILAYIKEGAPVPAETKQEMADSSTPRPQSQPAAPKPTPHIAVGSGDEIIEMDRMRKLIADHMVSSKHTSPHVTSFVEADVTNLVNWRNKAKVAFKEREGENLTFTPLFVEAIVKAIKDFPLINVSVDGDKIIKRKNINIGMAAALPSGNLIVPVIKNADFMNLTGLAKTVNDLASRARANQLKPDEIQGGTYTVTNVGTFGNVMGTPIINQPQVAIMAMGAIVKKPAVLETEQGDVIAIRHKMYLSHAYDHRVVDGALGGMFVRRVADYLEQWDVNREV
jgi:2-oxoglutarate dehydrogenase E2 component (dihydrolipoamide succinyltransferase)